MMVRTIVAKCKNGCRDGEGCACVLITEAPDDELPDAAIKVRRNFGCLFGNKSDHECALFIFIEDLSSIPKDTIRDREFECDGCDAHCRLAFNERRPFMYSPTFACPREIGTFDSSWWNELGEEI